jgi:hypothetical protein
VGGQDEPRNPEAEARACGRQLLELSEVYENVTVPQACPDEWPITVAIVARQRRHLQAVITLADAGLFLEAEIVNRTMFEFFIRQKWLLLDADLHRLLWLRDDINYRFTIDRETREWAEANGQQVEILRPDVRANLEQACDRINERVTAITAERALARAPTYPALVQQASAVGNRIDYSLGYRLGSQSAAHPSALGLENMLRRIEGAGVRVLPEPLPQNRLNVYGIGAIYLHEALHLAGELIPQLRIDDLADIAEQLAELSVMPSTATPTLPDG